MMWQRKQDRELQPITTMPMPDTEDYIVFDRTGTPHVVVAIKTEIGGECPQSGNREVEG